MPIPQTLQEQFQQRVTFVFLIVVWIFVSLLGIAGRQFFEQLLPRRPKRYFGIREIPAFGVNR